MREGKDVLDVAMIYTNRYAFGISANSEGFLLSCIGRGVDGFVLPATRQEMKR